MAASYGRAPWQYRPWWKANDDERFQWDCTQIPCWVLAVVKVIWDLTWQQLVKASLSFVQFMFCVDQDLQQKVILRMC